MPEHGQLGCRLHKILPNEYNINYACYRTVGSLLVGCLWSEAPPGTGSCVNFMSTIFSLFASVISSHKLYSPGHSTTGQIYLFKKAIPWHTDNLYRLLCWELYRNNTNPIHKDIAKSLTQYCYSENLTRYLTSVFFSMILIQFFRPLVKRDVSLCRLGTAWKKVVSIEGLGEDKRRKKRASHEI
jgi:hypothetical protein